LDRRLAELVGEVRKANEQQDTVKDHITQVGRDIVREVDHNTRGAVGNLWRP
jgi:hypothetical protein